MDAAAERLANSVDRLSRVLTTHERIKLGNAELRGSIQVAQESVPGSECLLRSDSIMSHWAYRTEIGRLAIWQRLSTAVSIGRDQRLSVQWTVGRALRPVE
jgi:hypothetical protein